MEHHFPLVAAHEESQRGHGVGVMDMNYIVVGSDAAQTRHHVGRDHGTAGLEECVSGRDMAEVVELYALCAAFGSGTEHIAFYAALRQTTCEVEHHFLHTSPYGPEFSNLE